MTTSGPPLNIDGWRHADGEGEVVAQRHWSDDRTETWVTIIKADPKTKITDEFIRDLINEPDNFPEVEVDLTRVKEGSDRKHRCPLDNMHSPDAHEPVKSMLGPCFYGAVFRIRPRGTDPLVYVVGDWDWRLNAWEIAWPD